MSTQFREAAERQEFVLPWCAACNKAFWYPRPVCPACLSDEIEYRPASGDGTVYAVSVQHKPGPMRDAADGPYPVVLVDLPEGVRVMGNVLGCPPDAVEVGMAVRATWESRENGRNVLQWELP
ncbi:MAG: OB-fold domain-containing protein [Actinomycetota bacterium]|nr:OB-fold domain-containing protein [Actinomycetota bacterium]